MKFILFLCITLLSFGNENMELEKNNKIIEKVELIEVEQPVLETIGIRALEEKLTYQDLKLTYQDLAKEILSLKSKIETYKSKIEIYDSKFLINETRFGVLDKVIQDNNQLVDEMEAKLDVIIKKINSENSEEIIRMKSVEKIVYRIVAIMIIVFFILLVMIIGTGLTVERKNRKKIEEWREILELEDHKK